MSPFEKIMRNAMNWIKNSLLICFSLFLAALIFEFGARIILPISPGAKKIDVDTGAQLFIPFNQPNRRYKQVYSEYNALTNIDNNGNRVTSTSNKESNIKILFLGDSFTFGQVFLIMKLFQATFVKRSVQIVSI